MKRTPINPSSWSVNLGFDLDEVVEGHKLTGTTNGITALGRRARARQVVEISRRRPRLSVNRAHAKAASSSRA
jgi:hypothetical protein